MSQDLRGAIASFSRHVFAGSGPPKSKQDEEAEDCYVAFQNATKGVDQARRDFKGSRLEDALNLLRKCRKALPEGHPRLPTVLVRLVETLLARFTCYGLLMDASEAVSVGHIFTYEDGRFKVKFNVVQAKALPNISRDSEVDRDLQRAIDILLEFRQSIDLQAINSAIVLYETAYKQCSRDHSHYPNLLLSYAQPLFLRYESTAQKRDLKDVISKMRQLQSSLKKSPHLDLQYVCKMYLRHALILTFLTSSNKDDWEKGMSFHLEMEEMDKPAAEAYNQGNTCYEAFQQGKGFKQLEQAIALLKQSLELRPGLHLKRAVSVTQLAVLLKAKYGVTDDVADLNDTIAMHREALVLRVGHPFRPATLGTLAGDLHVRFHVTGNMEDVEEAIALHREALELRPRGHPSRPFTLHNLAACLRTSFTRKGEIADREEYFVMAKEAMELLPPDSEHFVNVSSTLATAYRTQFETEGNLEDLEKAIGIYRICLDSTSPKSPDRAPHCTSLAIAFKLRYVRLHEFSDLDTSIAYCEEGLEIKLDKANQSEKGRLVNALGISRYVRYEARGQDSDLQSAIRHLREAVELRPHPHPFRMDSLTNLATSLLASYNSTGNSSDLDEAVVHLRESVQLLPPGREDRVVAVNSLATALTSLFGRECQLSVLEEAISLRYQVINTKGVSKRNRVGHLNNLGVSLYQMFSFNGDLSTLEETIGHLRRARELALQLQEDTALIATTDGLAMVLQARFEERGDITDLEESVSLHESCLEPQIWGNMSDQSHVHIWANLASTLLRASRHEVQEGALDKSIDFFTKATELMPTSNSPQTNLILSNYAAALQARFDKRGDIKDLDQAITNYRKVLEVVLPTAPNRAMLLNQLGNALVVRYHHQDQIQDIDEAVLTLKQALELKNGSRSHPISLLHLTTAYRYRFERHRDPADLDQSLAFAKAAATSPTGPFMIRMKCALIWAVHAHENNHESTPEAYQYAMKLLPLIASLDLDMKQRQNALSNTYDLVAMAGRYSIESGQLEQAVVYLSTGKSLFWSQALKLRAPLDDIAVVAPKLAKRLKDIARQLERHSAMDDTSIDSDLLVPSRVDYVELAKEWEYGLDEVRRLPGFSDFLKPNPFAKLKGCASKGPVVILNSSDRGCDALILTPGGGLLHVPLPKMTDQRVVRLSNLVGQLVRGHGFSADHLEEMKSDFTRGTRLKAVRKAEPGTDSETRFRSIFEIVWTGVVEPIISVLGLEKASSETPKTRVWWCSMGPFAFLPIHAAGIYHSSGQGQDILMDYCIPSYCSTLQELLSEPPPPSSDPVDFKFMAVIQPETEGASSLPNTIDEFNKIKAHVPLEHRANCLISHIGVLDRPTRPQDILLDLPDVAFAHFGCHGVQNFQNPLESRLLLSGGDLKMSDIINCRTNKASLAYLSACETAMGDASRPDEAMHLASTMLFAGFRGVVATLWEIADADAPVVADIFYGHLFRNKFEVAPDFAEAAFALHLAIRKLRDQDVKFSRWVPFVHFGL